MIKYCSISEKPGTFGENFHNEGYKHLGLDAIYIALKVGQGKLDKFIGFAKDNFSGISVSKPHKVEIIKHLDHLDDLAESIGSVNTVKLDDGQLVGYNTDYYGALNAIQNRLGNLSGRRVVMLGAGGAARAVAHAVKDLEGYLTIINRNEQKAKDLAEKLSCTIGDYSRLARYKGDLFINATSIGMGDIFSPLSTNEVKNYEAIMDIVVGDTLLIKQALDANKKVISGKLMTLHQATKQALIIIQSYFR